MIEKVTVQIAVKRCDNPFCDETATWTAKDVVEVADDLLTTFADENFVFDSVTLVDVE